MQTWLRRGSNRMPLPVEATTIDVPANGVVMDETGGARLLLPKQGTVEYRVGMAAEPVVAGRPASSDIELARAIAERRTELAAKQLA